MGSDLVFDACPDLVAVDEGKRKLAATRPGAEKQASLFSCGERRTLRIGEFT